MKNNILINTVLTNIGFDDALIQEISSISKVVDFNTNEYIIDYTQKIEYMPILLEGAIKILREDYEEGELLLYFVEKGDTCAMSLACCLGNSKSEIRAVAETPVKIIMIPVDKMDTWLGKYKSWRDFIFKSYNSRLKEMLNAIDSLAFLNLNDRLYKYLKEKAKISNTKFVSSTHQEIAFELHTSRVVVSRLLKALENEKLIKLHRASIEILK
jgi:CRP/FNR family transcriptional regulator, anaerobic regulatory protein